MRVVFMGTPEFAVPSLEALCEEFTVSLVVTRPDAIRGRGKTLVPSPVKEKALFLGIDVLEASHIDNDVIQAVRRADPDIISVAAFGCILPEELLGLARLECINVHASLLPRWRGAAPIQRAILANDTKIGVSIMRVSKALDAGAFCRQASLELGDKGAMELTTELALIGASELVCAIHDIEAGTATWTEQDEARITYAPKIEKHELLLDPEESALNNLYRIRASSDEAPARAFIAGRGVRVLKARVASEIQLNPGTVEASKDGLFIGCSHDSLEILTLKPDGKKSCDARAWCLGLAESNRVWEHI